MSIPARLAFHQPIPSPTRPSLPCPYTDHLLPRPTLYGSRSIHIPSRWSALPQHVPLWEAALLPTDLPPIVTNFIRTAHLQGTTIYHCSDGSSMNDTGSFGWAFGPNATIIFRHSGPAFGTPMDSYLAEGYGLLSSSCFWFRATKFALRRHLPRFKLHLYCDNKSLIRRVHEFLQSLDGSFRRSLTPNHDVVFLIACVLRQFPPGVIKLRHVKGHQDTIQPPHQLPWTAQLNVLADRLASQFHNHIDNPHPTPFLPSAQIHLRDATNAIIIKRWNFYLRSVYFRTQYQTWLCRQFSWDPPTLADVDFDGLSVVLCSLPTYIRRFVTKWINQGLPVRRRVHRYDTIIPPTCRSCPSTIECDSHLLRCPSNARRSVCADAYLSLHDKLTQLHTDPILHQTVLHLLSTVLDIPSCPPHATPAHALARQQTIGSLAFVKGRWSRVF